MTYRQATFTVLVTPSQSLPGQWVAHCLNIDLVSQGDSIGHALAMVKEAVEQVVSDDIAHGFDPLDRETADQERWQIVASAERAGRPLTSLSDGERDAVTVVIAKLRVVVPAAALPDSESQPLEVELIPPAWQIAALESMRPACLA